MLGKIPCVYSRFDNGQRIYDEHRFTYRRIEELRHYFPEPFETSDPGRSYFHWYEASQGQDGVPRLPRPEHTLKEQGGFSEKLSREHTPKEQGGFSGMLSREHTLRRLIRSHAPEPALKLARAARRALRGISNRG
jgi:hypothetical protein